MPSTASTTRTPNGAVGVERPDDGERPLAAGEVRGQRLHVRRGHRPDPVERLVQPGVLAVHQLGLAEPRHPRAGVLQPEHQPAGQLAVRPRQLLGRRRRRRPAAPARPTSSVDDLVDLGRRAAGVEPEVAGVGVARTRTSTPSTPARASRGSPGTAATLMPPPSTALSTDIVNRRGSVAVSDGRPEDDVAPARSAGARRSGATSPSRQPAGGRLAGGRRRRGSGGPRGVQRPAGPSPGARRPARTPASWSTPPAAVTTRPGGR